MSSIGFSGDEGRWNLESRTRHGTWSGGRTQGSEGIALPFFASSLVETSGEAVLFFLCFDSCPTLAHEKEGGLVGGAWDRVLFSSTLFLRASRAVETSGEAVLSFCVFDLYRTLAHGREWAGGEGAWDGA